MKKGASYQMIRINWRNRVYCAYSTHDEFKNILAVSFAVQRSRELNFIVFGCTGHDEKFISVWLLSEETLCALCSANHTVCPSVACIHDKPCSDHQDILSIFPWARCHSHFVYLPSIFCINFLWWLSFSIWPW